MSVATAPAYETTVLHVGGLSYVGEKDRVEGVLGVRPGVLAVEANAVAQTATVTFDPTRLRSLPAGVGRKKKKKKSLCPAS